MTVQTETARVQYTGSGTTGPFTISFYFLADADLRVVKTEIATGIETELVLTTDYTVTGAGDENGGSLTLTSSLSSSYTLTILREPQFLQPASYPRNDPFPAATHEQAIDRLTMLAQLLNDRDTRSIKAPVSVGSDQVIDDEQWAAREGKFIGFDAGKNLILGGDTGGADNALRTDLAASTGSSRVGTTQSGTGAGARTVQDKERDVVSVKDFKNNDGTQVAGVGALYEHTGIQKALDAHLSVLGPQGNYVLNAPLVYRPYHDIGGQGRSEFLITAVPDSTNIQGTRLFQRAACPVLSSTTWSGAPLADDGPVASYVGKVILRRMALTGNYNGTTTGRYGIYNRGANQVSIEDVLATFLKDSGIYIAASVINYLKNVVVNYCEDAGIDLAYNSDQYAASYNAYQTTIIGGTCSQNKNANVRIGTSARNVNIIGMDSESAGNYYPTGTGYGLHVTGQCIGLLVLGGWYEGNKIHMVLGPDDGTTTTVPENVTIKHVQFWSHTGGAEKIRLNSGKNYVFDGNHFLGAASYILLKGRARNPVLRNNTGTIKLVTENGDTVAYEPEAAANVFPEPDISAWTLTNCTVAQEEVDSPGGVVRVWKVTPSGAGLTGFVYIASGLGIFTKRNTFGAWMKHGTANINQQFGWSLSTSGAPTSYSNYTDVDIGFMRDKWEWQSFGGHVDDGDAGNTEFGMYWTAANTDPVYITDFQAVEGITHKPIVREGQKLVALADSATPSVLGLSTCKTGGTTTITNLTKGAFGQVLTIVSEHAITITDGTNIFLNGSVNFVMAATDTLTLVRKADGKWYEIGRSDNT